MSGLAITHHRSAARLRCELPVAECKSILIPDDILIFDYRLLPLFIPPELLWRNDVDAAKLLELEKVLIARDKTSTVSCHCSSENHIIVGIAADCTVEWLRRNEDHPCLQKPFHFICLATAVSKLVDQNPVQFTKQGGGSDKLMSVYTPFKNFVAGPMCDQRRYEDIRIKDHPHETRSKTSLSV